jgi:hypothetical protein
MHQVIEDMLDHYRIFNTGYRLHGAATDATGLDVDVDNTLEPLRRVIEARPSVGVGGSSVTLAWLLPPRFAGVTNARCLLLGANTP